MSVFLYEVLTGQQREQGNRGPPFNCFTSAYVIRKSVTITWSFGLYLQVPYQVVGTVVFAEDESRKGHWHQTIPNSRLFEPDGIHSHMISGGSHWLSSGNISSRHSLRPFYVSTKTNSGAQNLRYFNYDTTVTAWYQTSLIDVCARFGSSIWVKSWVTSSSDTKIKQDTEDINDDSALNVILAIQPKTYNYIDKIAKGNKKVYGFISHNKYRNFYLMP